MKRRDEYDGPWKVAIQHYFKAKNDNPFALFTAAHLLTQKTAHDNNTRYDAKRLLIGLLVNRKWDRGRIDRLFTAIDWMMSLPAELEAKLVGDIQEAEDATMEYVTTFERHFTKIGRKEGREEGQKEGIKSGKTDLLLKVLKHRFGELPVASQKKISAAKVEQLDRWTDAALDAIKLDDVFA